MNWFSIALSCAFLTACSDALSKRIMQENDEWITGCIVLGIAAAILFPVFLSFEPKPVSVELIVVLALALPFETIGYYLFLLSIRIAPLSLTLPLLAFTPVFTIVTAAIILGEGITASGAVGISLVACGAYLLNADLAGRNLFAPLRAIFSNRGSRLMLLVALIWAVTSTLGKKGLLIYGAIPFGFLVEFEVFVVFVIIEFFRYRRGTASVRLRKGAVGVYLLAGLFMAGAQVTHFVSLSMAPVAYMIAVKRLSMVFGVLLGWLMFHEESIAYRLFGASVMVIGVFFLPA